jgi:predicted transcriptional regulator of viral defense system
MITSANVSPREKGAMQTLFFNPEQTRELMHVCPNALVVMQHYVAIGKQVNPVMEDDQLAKLLDLKPAQIKAIRLALTKAGWFKRIKHTANGKTVIVYLVGKQAVQQNTIASVIA